MSSSMLSDEYLSVGTSSTTLRRWKRSNSFCYLVNSADIISCVKLTASISLLTSKFFFKSLKPRYKMRYYCLTPRLRSKVDLQKQQMLLRRKFFMIAVLLGLKNVLRTMMSMRSMMLSRESLPFRIYALTFANFSAFSCEDWSIILLLFGTFSRLSIIFFFGR